MRPTNLRFGSILRPKLGKLLGWPRGTNLHGHFHDRNSTVSNGFVIVQKLHRPFTLRPRDSLSSDDEDHIAWRRMVETLWQISIRYKVGRVSGTASSRSMCSWTMDEEQGVRIEVKIDENETRTISKREKERQSKKLSDRDGREIFGVNRRYEGLERWLTRLRESR